MRLYIYLHISTFRHSQLTTHATLSDEISGVPGSGAEFDEIIAVPDRPSVRPYYGREYGECLSPKPRLPRLRPVFACERFRLVPSRAPQLFQ